MPQDMRTYWTFQDDMAVIDGVMLKGLCIEILQLLQRQTLWKLHVNHLGINKTKLLACESIYWPGMNNHIENDKKVAIHVLIFSECSQRKSNLL